MPTVVYSHPDCLTHETPQGHPEQIARLDHIHTALKGVEGLRHVDAPMGEDTDIVLCHPARYIARIHSAIPTTGTHGLDADTHLSSGSMQAARRAVGGACAAVDHVMTGGNAFVATRPPGHHAETETPMGFCLFGNAAIAAKHALERHGLNRVAVVDFDVHHGNGTQDLLWNEDRALFVTSQQMPLWPGTGDRSETGEHGNVINIPLPPESDGLFMRRTYEAEVFSALNKFKPELMIISAGFDAHRDDPLAQLNWIEDDFVWLTRNLCEIAKEHANGRVVSVLEGGYNLSALAASVTAHVKTLMEYADD